MKQCNIRKGGKPLSINERVLIEIRWGKDYKTISEIARELGRHKSTISRELKDRPRSGLGKYQASIVHNKALVKIGKRGNTPKTTRFPELKDYIEAKLKLGWSPEQISLRLPLVYEANRDLRISPEAVYQEVYRRVRRGGNGEVKPGIVDLRPFLPRRHKVRAKKGLRQAQKLERVGKLPSIEDRPPVVTKRSRVGDWEDDTVVSRASLPRVKSTNERKTGIALFRKTKDGTAEACDKALVEAFQAIPEEYRLTLTRDRGSENRRSEAIKNELNLTEGVYYAHPYCSYERGSNENANGLLRRFFPKGTDWNLVSDEELAKAEYLINNRPRKRFGGLTPVEVFYNDTGVALYS
jgi:transposase, IS30 family